MVDDPDRPWPDRTAPLSSPSGEVDPAVRMRALFRLDGGRLATLYLDTGEWDSTRPTLSLWRLQAEVGPLQRRLPHVAELQAAAQRSGVTLLRVILPN